jgi:integrase
MTHTSFIEHLSSSGAKTATIRRRLNSIKALLEYGYLEGGVEKRNPFAQLQIPGEGQDAKKRGTFTDDQLREACRIALSADSEIKLIVPLLGETGCRLAEIVGLRLCDVDTGFSPSMESMVFSIGCRMCRSRIPSSAETVAL